MEPSNEPLDNGIIQWSVASRALPGQSESGDAFVVRSCDGRVLVAVIDAIGHGAEAARAARIATATLCQSPCDPLPVLLSRCNEQLRGTRGAVMNLTLFDGRANQLWWVGIGNVEGMLLRAGVAAVPRRTPLVPRQGFLGAGEPACRVVTLPIAVGDTVVLATDGIRPMFSDTSDITLSPRDLANHILARYGLKTDDALVLVARYLGLGPPPSR